MTKADQVKQDDAAWEGRRETNLAIIEQVGQGFRSLVFGAVILGVAYFAKEALTGVAGQFTVVDVLANVNVSISIAWVATAGAAFWGYRERQLRQRLIKKFGEQRERLERAHDPSRSSSGLSENGTNNPEDET